MSYTDVTTSLPDCNSITATPCAPCFFGGRTSYLAFPYTLTSTATVTVYPVYTGVPSNSTFLSYETDTITVPLNQDGAPIPTFGANLTWTTNGLTLTSGTTYASFGNFSGAAPSPTVPDYLDRREQVVRTTILNAYPYQRSPSAVLGGASKTCVGLSDISSIALPATVEPSSFVVPLTASSNVQFKENVLPPQILQYLEGLSTVEAQLGGNNLETCSPTTYPQPTPVTCTYLTTIAPSATTRVVCPSAAGSVGSYASRTTNCTTYTSNLPAPASSTIIATSVSTAPAVATFGSPPAIVKTSGLSILTETGTQRLKLPTGVAQSPAEDNTPTTPPVQPPGDHSPTPGAQSPAPPAPIGGSGIPDGSPNQAGVGDGSSNSGGPNVNGGNAGGGNVGGLSSGSSNSGGSNGESSNPGVASTAGESGAGSEPGYGSGSGSGSDSGSASDIGSVPSQGMTGVIIDGQTALAGGAPITIGGTEVSALPIAGGFVIGGSTTTIDAGASNPILSIAGQPMPVTITSIPAVSIPLPGSDGGVQVTPAVVVNGHTATAGGSPITVDGSAISVAPGGSAIIVDGSTMMPFTAGQTTAMLSIGNQAVTATIISVPSESMSAGSSTSSVISGSGSRSGTPAQTGPAATYTGAASESVMMHMCGFVIVVLAVVIAL